MGTFIVGGSTVDVEHLPVQRWLDRMLGPPSDRPMRFPTRFRLYVLTVFTAIALWMVAYVTYVVPFLRKELHLRSSSEGNQNIVLSIELHVLSLFWFALTRAMHFLPCVAARTARLHSRRQASYKQAGLKLLLMKGHLLHLLFSASCYSGQFRQTFMQGFTEGNLPASSWCSRCKVLQSVHLLLYLQSGTAT